MKIQKPINTGVKEVKYKSYFLYLLLCLLIALSGTARAQNEAAGDFGSDEISVLKDGDSLQETEVKYEEEKIKHVNALKGVHESVSRQTDDCKSALDSLFFTLQSMAKQARENGEAEREKDILAVLNDYSSFKGDVDAMSVLLDMAELAEDTEFARYFTLMSQSYEHLKGDFNLKNELFLRRISELKDEDALRYEKKLYRLFCNYFEYDFWRDSQAWPAQESQDNDFISQEAGSEYGEF